MGLLKKYLLEAIGRMERDRVKMKFFGDLTPLPRELRELCERTEEIAKQYDGVQVNICLNYGGRDEIIRACRRLPPPAPRGETAPGFLDEAAFGQYLFSAGVPDPDLIIRPAGKYVFPTSCCGSPPMRNSILPTCCGPTFPKTSCIGRWRLIRAAPAVLEVFEWGNVSWWR